MKKSCLLLLLFCFQIFFGQETLPETNPENVGLSQTQLQNIDALLAEYIEKDWVPGGVFLIARKGKIAYHKALGKRDFKKEYQQDDIFRLASMTKAVTVVATMQLWEKGMFTLDDPIENYLPEFANRQVLDTFNEKDSTYTTKPAKSSITIRHLLTHSSGIYYADFSFGKLQAVYAKAGLMNTGISHEEWTNKEFMQRLAKLPLAFNPGEKYMYGLNMDVLGYLIETLTGKTLEEYFVENIFDPLGMNDTFFYLPKNKAKKLVPVYAEIDNKMIMSPDERIQNYPNWENRIHFSGGGGLSGTALDYAKFCQALLNGGTLNGQRILGRKTIALMTSEQVANVNVFTNEVDPSTVYTLGFLKVTNGIPKREVRSTGTYSWGGFFNTQFFIDPKEELVFVGMTQISPTLRWEFWTKLDAIIYAAIDD